MKIEAKGVDKVLRSMKTVPPELLRALDNDVERAALKVVNEAKHDAPYETGALKNSIDVLKDAPLSKIIGSPLPYAQRQEYEHRTRKGYFRKNLQKEREPFRKAIESTLRRVGR